MNQANAESATTGHQSGGADTNKTDLNNEASFRASYESIDAFVKSKLQRYEALAQLAGEEAKLSFNALLVAMLGGIMLIGVVGMFWFLLNVLAGIALHYIMQPLLVVIVLLAVNALCGFGLLRYLRKVRGLIGFSKSFARIKE